MNSAHHISEANTSVIILAAGMSERFGQPKAFLRFPSGETFLEKLIQVYHEAHVNKIVLVINESIANEAETIIASFGEGNVISLIVNKNPAAGRYTSIQLGADSVGKDNAAFIQNIDNPFTTTELIESMKTKLQPGKYVVPVCNGEKGHPVLLSSEIMEHIRRVSAVDANLRNILKAYDAVELEIEDTRIHANLNTEKEYRKYFAHETSN